MPARRTEEEPTTARARSAFGLCACTFALLAVAPGPRARAADWPEFGGPRRDFVAPVELAPRWPDTGPATIWRVPLGPGYSSIVVDGDLAFTIYRDGDDEVTVALRLADGSRAWQHRAPAPFAASMNMEFGSGPHATPVVSGGRVFVVGIHGNLVALDRVRGTRLWSRGLIDELGGTPMDRGYASTPIAYGDTLIASVGGRGRGLVALDQRTGTTVWQSQDFDGTYSSPMLVEVNGSPQLVLMTPDGVVGVDPRTGRQLWSHAHPTQYGLNISLPAWVPSSDGGLLFLSSAYDGGSRVVRLRAHGGTYAAEQLWANHQVRLHIGNAQVLGDYVVASSGDFGPVPMTAVDLRSGEVLWRDRAFARAFLVRAGDHLVVLDEDGVLGLATASRSGLEVLARHPLFRTKTWTPPTLVDHTLLARDQAEAVALRLP